jgi:hypothetical protein
MKKVIGLVCALLLCTTLSYSQVKTIISGGVDGPNGYFPTVVTILCNGTGGVTDCPQYFSPDWSDTSQQRLFGITNLVSPPRCVRSTDGGTTWVACPAHPFAAVSGASTTSFAMNYDGHLFAAVNVDGGANACQIRRSTDLGVSWVTVFALPIATGFCTAGNVAMPSPMKCSQDSDTCILLAFNPAGTSTVPIVSNDNGATWVAGAVLASSSGANPFIGVSMDIGGTLGVSGGSSVQPATSRLLYTDGGLSWLVSTPPATLPGASHRCTGAVQNNLTSRPTIICTPGNAAPNDYYYMEITGGGAAILDTFTLIDGLAFTNSPDVIALQYDTNTFYLVQRSLTVLKTNVYITRDGFSSVHLLAQPTPINLFVSCCRGDIYKWSGDIYFSSGGTGGSAQLYRIR